MENQSTRSEALKKAQANYKKKMNRVCIDFSPAESEMWEFLQTQKKQVYIKSLIREDMRRKTTEVE